MAFTLQIRQIESAIQQSSKETQDRLSRKTRRHLRQMLVAATIGGVLISTPQIANAATHTLTGAHADAQSVTSDGDSVVDVRTGTPTFSVDTTMGTALTISGAGEISYDDGGKNNILITADIDGDGLSITSTGNNANLPAKDGSISVTSSGIISGGRNGINAENQGTGDTTIVINGSVSGNNGNAIRVFQRNVDAGDMTISVAASSSIKGGSYGIFARNSGTGLTSITTSGDITVTDNGSGSHFDGINVLHDKTGAGDVLVQVLNNATISGAQNGIVAGNNGTGTTTVIATGSVTGGLSAGIAAFNNSSNGGNVTVNAATVSGGSDGIRATNSGIGNTEVIATGLVTGGVFGNGISASNSKTTGAGNVIVKAGDVSGGRVGIFARNSGDGNTSVESSGTVRNTNPFNSDAIFVQSLKTQGTGTVTVNATNVIGGSRYGINVSNSGQGATEIITNGDVQGDTAAINIRAASTTNLSSITINSESYVHHSDADPAALAIQISGASGGAAQLTNKGLIVGTLVAGEENDTFANEHLWNIAAGTSDFGDGADILINTGTIQAFNGTGATITNINGIEIVNNNIGSSITMQDGHVGDITTFTNGGNGIFNTNGGSLLVDADIAAQTSDVLRVDNLGGGRMAVDANIVNGLGQRTTGDGVLVVNVTGDDDNTSLNSFALASSISGGLYDYHLNRGQNSPDWFLQSAIRPAAAAMGILPILGSRTALSTLSNMHDRQRDPKVLLDDADSQKGVWGRVFGQSNDFRTDDTNDFGFDSNVWGAQAGLDLLASGDQNGNRKFAGLYVAYASADGDSRQFDHKIASLDLDATTIGAYYTRYSSNNWYVDAVAQYTRLSGIKANTSTDDMNPDGNSYALSLEVGQQFNPQSNFVSEVQAQIIDQYTEIDDVRLNDGSSLNLSNLNAVTGRVGVRLYGNPQKGKTFLPWLRANIWHTFTGNSTVSSMGNSIDIPIGGTSGELEIGFSKGQAESGGWGFYGSAGYLFDLGGAEYSGWKGTLGLRKGW